MLTVKIEMNIVTVLLNMKDFYTRCYCWKHYFPIFSMNVHICCSGLFCHIQAVNLFNISSNITNSAPPSQCICVYVILTVNTSYTPQHNQLAHCNRHGCFPWNRNRNFMQTLNEYQFSGGISQIHGKSWIVASYIQIQIDVTTVCRRDNWCGKYKFCAISDR
jgi:hypothetical protein